MVLGLLMLAAIPTVAGISLGISERSKPSTIKKEKELLRKFTLVCWCSGRGKGKIAIHHGEIVLGEGKVWIQSPDATPEKKLFPFTGFYLDYPDDERPPPPPTGLVSQVRDDPPLLNWIYIDKSTGQLCHGNRSDSRPHWVGNFGWTYEDEDNDEDEPGGLEFQNAEQFVAVEPAKGSTAAGEGRWEVWWDKNDDRLEEVEEVKGRTVLRISLERCFLHEEEGLNYQTGKAGEAGDADKGPKAKGTDRTKVSGGGTSTNNVMRDETRKVVAKKDEDGRTEPTTYRQDLKLRRGRGQARLRGEVTVYDVQ